MTAANMRIIIEAVLTFCYIINVWTCLQIIVLNSEFGEESFPDKGYHYANTLELVTATFTTVGYGNSFPTTFWDMIFCIPAIWFGAVFFAMMQSKTQEYKTPKTVGMFLQDEYAKSRDFNYSLKGAQGANLDNIKLFENEEIENKFYQSPKYSLAKNKFYLDLPPKLQSELTRYLFGNLMSQFSIFFSD